MKTKSKCAHHFQKGCWMEGDSGDTVSLSLALQPHFNRPVEEQDACLVYLIQTVLVFFVALQ